MAKVNAQLLAMNRGEVSKLALTRVDVERLRLSAACQLNWMPYVIGPMSLRPGLGLVGNVLSDLPTKLIKFIYSKLDTALLEFTPNVMRIWVNDQLVSRPAVSTAVSNGTFGGSGGWDTSATTAGASVTIGSGQAALLCSPIGALASMQQLINVAAPDQNVEHGLRIVVANGPVTVRVGSSAGLCDLVTQTDLDSGTHALAFTPTGSFVVQIESTDEREKRLSSVTIDAPGVLTVPTTWGAGDLANIRIDESGDVIFAACAGQQQSKVERRSTHGWSFVVYRSNDGPFQSRPAAAINFAVDTWHGNGLLTSDANYFRQQHVGCLFRLFTPGQQNGAILAGQNAYTHPVRVSGVGQNARNYSWLITGTWAGTLTFERSFDGPFSGYTTVSSVTTSPTTILSATGTPDTPNLDNVICWERVGFAPGNYGSGSASVQSEYFGGGAYGICRVTNYRTPQAVDMEVLSPFSSLLATKDWVEGNWSSVSGWPTSVAFHEGRLGWFGSRWWLSGSDLYAGFAEIDSTGETLGDAGVINEAFGSGPVDNCAWGLSLTRLLIGREQSIGSVRSSNFDQPLTPTALVIRDCSDQGAERLPAIKAGKRGIFVQQGGRKVYELAFSGQDMDYTDRDLTRLNLDIGKTGYVAIDKATQPDKMIYLPRGDGQCAAMLYDVDDQVEAWWRIQTLGVIEDVVVLPAAGNDDYVYFVVRRTVDGVQKRFIEKLASRDQCTGGAINRQLDCFLVYQGAPVTTLRHASLPNTELCVWADGAYIGKATTNYNGTFTMPDGLAHNNVVYGLGGLTLSATTTNPGEELEEDQTLEWREDEEDELREPLSTLVIDPKYEGYPCEVFADIGATGNLKHVGAVVITNGTIPLPNGAVASTIVAFVGYMAPFYSAKLAYGAQMGSALTMKKKIDHVGLVLYDTAMDGLKFGQDPDTIDDLPAVEGEIETDPKTVWPEYDEPMIGLPGKWNTDARLFLLAQAPKPCTVGGVVIGMTTNEKG